MTTLPVRHLLRSLVSPFQSPPCLIGQTHTPSRLRPLLIIHLCKPIDLFQDVFQHPISFVRRIIDPSMVFPMALVQLIFAVRLVKIRIYFEQFKSAQMYELIGAVRVCPDEDAIRPFRTPFKGVRIGIGAISAEVNGGQRWAIA